MKPIAPFTVCKTAPSFALQALAHCQRGRDHRDHLMTFPEDRVIAWVSVRNEDGTEKLIPWLRDPKTPEELAISDQASRIIQRAQEQQKAQVPISGKERRHKAQRLRQFRNRLRGNPQK
jgi:hypothetical protein